MGLQDLISSTWVQVDNSEESLCPLRHLLIFILLDLPWEDFSSLIKLASVCCLGSPGWGEWHPWSSPQGTSLLPQLCPRLSHGSAELELPGNTHVFATKDTTLHEMGMKLAHLGTNMGTQRRNTSSDNPFYFFLALLSWPAGGLSAVTVLKRATHSLPDAFSTSWRCQEELRTLIHENLVILF